MGRNKHLDVRLYTELDRDHWDEFVQRSVNGTFVHTRRFLSYHPPDRFRDHSLIVSEGGSWETVFLAAEVSDGERRVLQSHPGTSYGGFVVAPEITVGKHSRAVASLLDYARAQGFLLVRMRVPEMVFRSRPSQQLEAAWFQNGFEIEARELSCAVRCVERNEEGLLKSYRGNTRREVLKARRSGVTVRFSDDYERYWEVLCRNLHDSHAVVPTHSLEEIHRLRQLFPDKVQLIASYLGGRLTAGAVIFFMNDVAAHTMYIAQDYAFNEFRCINLVLHEAILECTRRGLRFLNFGISSIPGSSGLQMNDGLDAFKRSYGGEGVVRDVYVRKLVSLDP